MLKKNPNRENVIDNIRHITLINADLKILSVVLAKRLAFVMDKLVERHKSTPRRAGVSMAISI